MNLVKIDGVIGSLESDDGLSLVNPWSCLFIRKCRVISSNPPNWKVKLNAEIWVLVVLPAKPWV